MKSHHENSRFMRSPSMKIPVRTSLVFAATAITLLAACGQGDSTPASESAGNAALKVVVQKPTASKDAKELILPGTVEAWESAVLFGRVTGYLDSVSVDIGDQVDAGTELARVIVPEMKAELSSARAHLAASKAGKDLARITQKRTEELHERNPEAISRQDVDEAAAKARVAGAQANVAQAELERLKTLMEFSVISAPFAGRITKRHLHPGALVTEGTSSNSAPVLEIARTDRLRIAFDIPEPAVGHIAKDANVTIMLDAYPGQTTEGKISRIAGALDPKTRAMRAEIDLENKGDKYKAGMYAKVILNLEAQPDALVIPSRAVRGQRDKRFVLVAQDGSLKRQSVVVIADDGRNSIVSQGLTLRTLVMIAGSPLATEGSEINAVEAPAP
jgi:RND family efflux transporter MFP subunit